MMNDVHEIDANSIMSDRMVNKPVERRDDEERGDRLFISSITESWILKYKYRVYNIESMI